ncbi:MAG: LCP family protein [Cellulomonadaceae bacterium]|nr:LCP family protein [Cellulomonadaceae bacterium]
MLLTVLVLLVIVGGTLAGVAVLGGRLLSNVEKIADPFDGLTNRPTAAVPTAAAEGDGAAPARAAMNILVLGSDSRISAGDPAQWTAGAQRTDAIMLVHLPADGSSAYVMSFPRDSWVDVPGYGEAKINAAYSYGGPTLLIQTFENLTHVRIDHFAIADFASFTAITDALGGVPITLADDLYSRKGDLMLTAGNQVLTGEQALVWVRERKNLPRGDFDRVQRQQAWMRAILTRVQAQGTLNNPVMTVRLLDTVSRSVSVDDGVTLGVIQDMVGRVKGLGSSDISFFTVPITGTGRSDDGQSIVLLDTVPFDALMAAVASDAVGPYLDEHSADVDVLPDVAP